MSLQEIKIKVAELRGKKNEIKGRIKEDEVEYRLLEKNKEELEKCIQLLTFISNLSQDKVIELFQHTIAAGLKDLFNDGYDFKFDMKTRGNSSSCDFLVKTNECKEWMDIKMCQGRSVQEIIGTIFRIVLVKLDKTSRKIVILDEPTGGIEGERQELMSKFLSEICLKFRIQLIIVTHSVELTEHASKRINLESIKNGEV
jgi:DNA repair exonuclease SbcCD ATPase subunit